MILVDSRIGSAEVAPYITRNRVPVEKVTLEYGDFAIEGNGKNGKINIGIERKTLHDCLHCIDDARYTAHQRPGMLGLYDQSFLIVEGCWKPHEDGTLMEGFKGGSFWGQCKYRSNRVMYSKLRRFLFSVSLSGVVVIYSRDITQTAYDLCEMFHYFSKPWSAHKSLLETQTILLPSLTGKPSLVRKIAAQITDVGATLSMEAEKQFRNAYTLINADEIDWMRIPKIGVKTAQQIVREIRTNDTR